MMRLVYGGEGRDLAFEGLPLWGHRRDLESGPRRLFQASQPWAVAALWRSALRAAGATPAEA